MFVDYNDRYQPLWTDNLYRVALNRVADRELGQQFMVDDHDEIGPQSARLIATFPPLGYGIVEVIPNTIVYVDSLVMGERRRVSDV